MESGSSILLLGKPGVGKTTKLRGIAPILADELEKRVIIIDTSNEIAGDGMIEAVENHMPEVIIIDEIGTVEEAMAARTIAERGVQLIATAHGNTLEVRERKAPPTFDVVVEIVGWDELIVHEDTARAVDFLLRGKEPGGVRRTPEGETALIIEPRGDDEPMLERRGLVRIHPYAISRDAVERAIRMLDIDACAVKSATDADLILALESRSSDRRLQRLATDSGVPIHAVKRNTVAQVRKAIQSAFQVMSDDGRLDPLVA